MKSRLFSKRYHPPGTSPGTLVTHRNGFETPLRISLYHFGPDHLQEHTDIRLAQCRDSLRGDAVNWIEIEGSVDAETLHELGDMLGLHQLALEDVLNRGQRPKLDSYEKQLFLILNLPCTQDGHLAIDQVCLFAGDNYVITIHGGLAQRPFRLVAERLRSKNSKLRENGPDFLLYALLDATIDTGYPVLEALGERIDALEDSVLDEASPRTVEAIHLLKRELLLLRRMIWPQREVLNELDREEREYFSAETRVYLRDCYDHTIQLMDLVEAYRDMCASLLDLHFSKTSTRLNEIMRVLTVIATLFIPPTFLTGIYGMNFDRGSGPLSMPELGWPLGYLMVWLLSLGMITGMLVYFRRKGWF
jgi:magnesium transporter